MLSVALSITLPDGAQRVQALPGSLPNGARTFLEYDNAAHARDHPASAYLIWQYTRGTVDGPAVNGGVTEWESCWSDL